MEINAEIVNKFLNGYDPMEHIITIECDYTDERVSIIYVNEKGQKMVKCEDFKPFVWVKHSAAIRMFQGNRGTLRRKLREYGIEIKALKTGNNEQIDDRLKNGYIYLFRATRKMSYTKFMAFFTEADTPIYDRKKSGQEGGSNKEFMAISPVEQYMISTGRRLFKGYNNYDDLKRMSFDLETQGLDPKIHAIEQIGIRTNKGYEKIISITGKTAAEKRKNELDAIEETLSIIAQEKPDVIFGHNSENFDWNFFIVRSEVLGTDFETLSLKYFKHPIYKKKRESILKLGGEMEYFRPTIAWGFIILDSLHAVRRAQALDSNMKSGNLKYVTQYLDLKKKNRVYVPGNIISKTWNITDEIFAFNDETGDWYELNEKRGLLDGYVKKSGKYIVERYLLDDIWEADKVELKLNESNFLVGKMLPTTFQRACTMGTAGIWKLIMLAWCYENELAVPSTGENKRFTGGLSRLLKTGYVDRIVKLDYNSLYPSIILTWNISTTLDITHIMLHLLEYILTEREKYKELKAKCGKKAKELKKLLKDFNGTKEEKNKIEDEMSYWKAETMGNDKKQLPLKILANSFFGSYGCPMVFPFGDINGAEKTTCIGRMCLRLMISHFTKLGYTPIVGDSFTPDTPLFIKYDESNLIDIKPIDELIEELNVKEDALGREYDYSKKPFKVLCRSGWEYPKYIYRHKTEKPIYEVSEGNMSVSVTEDHSLFNDRQEKIKPSEINGDTKFEYYKDNVDYECKLHPKGFAVKCMAKWLMRGEINRVPVEILNANKSTKKEFLSYLKGWNYSNTSKTCRAGMQFIEKEVYNDKI